MTKEQSERRCTNCEFKKSCSMFQDGKEKTLSGWDKNRTAITCLEYREECK